MNKTYKLSSPIIARNSIKCLNCNTEIVSNSQHDYVTCPCKKTFVDGGRVYLRFGGVLEYIKDTSIVSDDLLVIREYWTWKSYGKSGKEEGKYIILKNMDTDHIQAILDTQWHIKETEIEELFKLELEYRKDIHKE